MTLMQLYLITVILPNMGIAIGMIAGGFCVTAIFWGIAAAVSSDFDEDEKTKEKIKVSKKCALLALPFLLLCGLFPSEKQLYVIAGGYVATNTKDVAKLPDNVVKAANAWLEKVSKLADQDSSKKKSNQ
jgi:hypothetical protein